MVEEEEVLEIESDKQLKDRGREEIQEDERERAALTAEQGKAPVELGEEEDEHAIFSLGGPHLVCNKETSRWLTIDKEKRETIRLVELGEEDDVSNVSNDGERKRELQYLTKERNIQWREIQNRDKIHTMEGEGFKNDYCGHLANQALAKLKFVGEESYLLEKKNHFLNQEWVSGGSSSHDECKEIGKGGETREWKNRMVSVEKEERESRSDEIQIKGACDHVTKEEKERRETRSDDILHYDIQKDGISQKSSHILNIHTHLAGNAKEWVRGESSSHAEDFSNQKADFDGQKPSSVGNQSACARMNEREIEGSESDIMETKSGLVSHANKNQEEDRERKLASFKWKTPLWLKQGTKQPTFQARRMTIVHENESYSIEEKEENKQESPAQDNSQATNLTKAHDTIFEGFQASNRRTLQFIAPESQNGIPIVKPNKEIVEEGAKKWKATAIGYLLGKKPYFYHLQSFARATWKGIKDIIVADNGFYLFMFETEKIMEDVIQGGPWLFNGQPLFLQKWHPGLSME